jgi:hypothetical protein
MGRGRGKRRGSPPPLACRAPRDTTRGDVRSPLRSRAGLAWLLGALLVRPVSADPPPSALPLDLRPEPAADPPVGWAMGAGTLTALLPLAVGGALFSGGLDVDRRKGASLAIASGLALAPIVSHLVVREWTRAAIFGAIPVACLAGMIALLEVQPTVTMFGTREGRLTYGLLLSFATLSAGAGLVDTVGASRRARDRRGAPRRALVLPTPVALPGGGGLTLTATF